jgi:hypothetical protein
MSSFLMSTRYVKTSPKRCGILWHKRVFFDYMYKVQFSPDFSIWIFQLFSLRSRHVSYINISSWCNMKVFTHYS